MPIETSAGDGPIALLCLGPVHEFYAEPMLQQRRWASRQPLHELVHDNRWGQASGVFSLGVAGAE